MDAAGEGDSGGMCFPYNVLLDILRRLPWRDVAASKCVCRLWRDILGDHGLSLERCFPRRAFPGLFINKFGCGSDTSFFAPSSTRFRLPFHLDDDTTVCQSCNGLLLLDKCGHYYVLNPATARCTHLPRPTTPWCSFAASLAFDPAVSLHYHVFLFQKGGMLKVEEEGDVPPLEQVQAEGVEEPTEKVLSMLVYSSRTCHWENREFAPGRCAPGHLYDVVAKPPKSYGGAFCSCEYWRESLYMHCHNSVLLILRPTEGTYDMVQLPGETCRAKSLYDLPRNSVLASYERGVHYVASSGSLLRLWMLTESVDGQLSWTLAHDANLNLHAHMIRTIKTQFEVTWAIVESTNGPVSLTDDDVEDEKENESDGDDSKYSWDSDEDNFIDVVERAGHHDMSIRDVSCDIMGFHPYKNALILMLNGAVVVYHLDTLRMQYLSNYYQLIKDTVQAGCGVYDSFTYRPCYEDVLIEKFSMSS
ncbi:hypothetical protein CFC21_044586 [Triticum aestivum]|uniref:F-box domain-containing protein n=2 Tax=Triticum aestivum TaxID=4565 RepID=A0A9R1FQV7_WHEAT|nr:hypothetical protein CFC21_044586 [Triticum aestivum]CDM86707.1 unnamed protein product [Triticum aestivum]